MYALVGADGRLRGWDPSEGEPDPSHPMAASCEAVEATPEQEEYVFSRIGGPGGYPEFAWRDGRIVHDPTPEQEAAGAEDAARREFAESGHARMAGAEDALVELAALAAGNEASISDVVDALMELAELIGD